MEVMSNEMERELFHIFLKSNFCDENFDFYMATIDYEQLPTLKQRKKTGTTIFNAFLTSTCLNPVNIPSDIMEKVTKNFEEGNFEENLFTDCKVAICKLLTLDSLPRFLSRDTSKNGFQSSSPGGSFLTPKPDHHNDFSISTQDSRDFRTGRSPNRKLSPKYDIDKKVTKRNKHRKSKSVDSVRLSESDQGPMSSPLCTFEDAYKDTETKNGFYKYLVQTFSNEYLEFYDEIIIFQNTLFEDEIEKKKSIDNISKKYLGIGDGSECIISVNFEVMDEFKDNLAKNNLSNIFTNMIVELNEVLNSLFLTFISLN